MTVRDGVDRDPVDRAVAQQDPFDGRGGQVLAVDPHPVGGAAGQVDPAVGVAVGQVSGPVHAVAHALGVGVRVVVVAGEETRAGRVHQLAHRFVGVDECPVGVEPGDGAFGDGIAVVDGHPVGAPPDGALGRAGFADHDDGVLGRPEAVLDLHTEPARELLDVLVVGLVAERHPQRIVGVVVAFGRGQDVGQRLADVVHVGGAVAADVVEEVARREFRRHDRGARAHRRRPSRDHRVGMKQRHRHVTGVPVGEGESLGQAEPGDRGHEVRYLHRLGISARSRREDHHEGVHRGDLPMRRQLAGGVDELGPLRRRGVEDARVRQLQAVQERAVLGVGHHELAVRAADVGGQRLAAAGGVQAAQHVATEPGRRHLAQHLGGVSQQGADVHRPGRIGGGQQGRGPRRRALQILTPTPLRITVFHRDR